MDLQALVLQAQQGDTAAYERVCRKFAGLIKKHAHMRHLAGIQADAECEAWVALAQAVKDYDPARGVPFAGFAERCVAYRLWNVFKKERRRWQAETPLDAEAEDEESFTIADKLAAAVDVSGEVERRELRDELRQALSALPLRQRQALFVTVIGDGRLLDLAIEWNVSVQAVHALRKKALANLRHHLKEAGARYNYCKVMRNRSKPPR